MTPNQYAVIIVQSTSHAIRMEKLLQAREMTCKLIPVPRQISSDCGVCIRILRQDIKAARQAVQGAQMEIQGIHNI